jgi:ribosomal protein L14
MPILGAGHNAIRMAHELTIHPSDRFQTMLNVIDNSGAAVAECVKVLRSKRAAKIGTRRNTTTSPEIPSANRIPTQVTE